MDLDSSDDEYDEKVLQSAAAAPHQAYAAASVASPSQPTAAAPAGSDVPSAAASSASTVPPAAAAAASGGNSLSLVASGEATASRTTSTGTDTSNLSSSKGVRSLSFPSEAAASSGEAAAQPMPPEEDEDNASTASTETEQSSSSGEAKDDKNTSIGQANTRMPGSRREVAASGRRPSPASSEQLFSDSSSSAEEMDEDDADDTRAAARSASTTTCIGTAGTAAPHKRQQEQPPPQLPRPEARTAQPALPDIQTSLSKQRDISIKVGTAALELLRKGRGRDEAIAQVETTVRSMIPLLDQNQSHSVAKAAVDALMSQTDADASGSAAAATTAPASNLPADSIGPPLSAADHEASKPQSKVLETQTVNEPAAPADPTAAPVPRVDASESSPLQSNVPLRPQAVDRPVQASQVAPASAKSDEAAESAKPRRHRTAFKDKEILAGPELYDYNHNLSSSNLALPSDQVVVAGSGSSRVEKIRGKITGVPRPSKQKDWFDVKWSIKDKNVLALLTSMIPASTRSRDLLKNALVGDDANRTSDDQEKTDKPVSLGVATAETSGIESILVGGAVPASASAESVSVESTSNVSKKGGAGSSTKSEAKPTSSKHSIIVFSDSSDIDNEDDDERLLSSFRSKSGSKTAATTTNTTTSMEDPILDDTSSSSDDDVLSSWRTKAKAKRDKEETETLDVRTMESQLETKTSEAIRKLPKYISGTSVKMFPSSRVVHDSIAVPLIQEYRDSLSGSRAHKFSDDEILKVDIVDDENDSNCVQCNVEGIQDLVPKLRANVEAWIDSQKESIHDDLEEEDFEKKRENRKRKRANESDSDSSHEKEDAVDCYQLGQVIQKYFPGHGLFKGNIIELPQTDHPYYLVHYTDGDEESIHVNKINKYIIDDVPSLSAASNKKKPRRTQSEQHRKKGKKVDRDKKPAASKGSTAVAPSASSASTSGKMQFKTKYLPVCKIEYQDSDISLTAATKSMWKRHVEFYGDSCDDYCPCPSNLELLTELVKADAEAKSGATIRVKPVGFVRKFAKKFYGKLQEEFPDSRPADLLRKLLEMWTCHSNDTRFGMRCRSNCLCGDAWQSLFLDQCLQPKQQEKVPRMKKRPAPDTGPTIVTESLPPSSRPANSIPRKKRKTSPGSRDAVASSSGGTLSVAKMDQTHGSGASSLVPLRPSHESALTQRIKRKDRGSTIPSSSGASGLKVQSAPLSARADAQKSPSLMREYSVPFNPKEPLGFFVVTESKKHGDVCKIASVSPATSEKDDRLQPGTIVVATGMPKSPVYSHVELRKRYDDAAKSGGGRHLLLHFINADVTASMASTVRPSMARGTKARTEWSKAGVWRGFSRVAGWAGGSKLQQREDDSEGAQQLKQSRARHMTSVSRYMPRGNISQGSSSLRGTGMAIGWNNGSIRSQSGPLQSILRKEGEARSKAVVVAVDKEAMGKASDRSDESPRPAKVNFVSDRNLVQVKLFSDTDEQRVRVEEPSAPVGLQPKGNDALSYAVEYQTCDEIIQLLESGAHVNQIDSEKQFPLDRAKEKYNNLKQERQTLKAKSGGQVLEALGRNDAELKAVSLEIELMRLYREAERIIDLAYYLRDWTKMQITVKGAKDLELTSKAKADLSSDYIYCTFTGRDGIVDERRTPKTSFSPSPAWSSPSSYTVEYNNEVEDLSRYFVEITLYKGDPTVSKDSLTTDRVSKWKENLGRIRQYGEKDKLNTTKVELHKNERLINGSLLIGFEPQEVNQEMMDGKRLDISNALSKLLDRITAVRTELSKFAGQERRLPGNISIPLSCDLSLLHAAIFAFDEEAVGRLLSMGADPKASSIAGSALELALDELAEAREPDEPEEEEEGAGKSNAEAVRKLEHILATLRKAASRTAGLAPRVPADIATTGDAARGTKSVQEQQDVKQILKQDESHVPQSHTPQPSEDQSKSQAPTDEGDNVPEKAASETNKEVQLSLPILVIGGSLASHWLPRHQALPKTKDRPCDNFINRSCCFGANCRYAHIHGEVGAVLDSPGYNPSQNQLNKFVPEQYIFILSERNDKGELFHTAAFSHRNDGIIYYAERGPGANLSHQGVYWYSEKHSAIEAVQRVVYCIVSSEGRSLQERFRQDDFDDRKGHAKKRRWSPPTHNPSTGSVHSSTLRSRSSSPVPMTTTHDDDERARSLKRHRWSPPAYNPSASSVSSSSPRSRSSSPVPVSTTQDNDQSGEKSKQQQQLSLPAHTGNTGSAPSSLPRSSSPSTEAKLTELPDTSKSWLKTSRAIHPPIGALLDNDAWCKLALAEIQPGPPYNYELKAEMNDDTFDLYYTAAFEDSSHNTCYYSERGGGKENPMTGVWWYPSEDEAKLAVKRVVAAAQKMSRDAFLLPPPQGGKPSVEEKPSVIDATRPAVGDDSSLSNMSLDESSSVSPTPHAHAATELPVLEVRDWIKGQSVRCKYFNSRTGCKRGRECNYAHVQSPIGQRLLNKTHSGEAAHVSDKFIHRKEALTPSFDLFYTAAYYNPNENWICYAEGGSNVGQSPQGIWWYRNEDDAAAAVKRAVAACGRPMAATKTSAEAAEAEPSDSLMRRLSKVQNHNLQPIFQKVFPGILLRKECWRFTHRNDGLVTVLFIPPKEVQGKVYISNVRPTWRRGTLEDKKWWYKDERTARNAAFMRFLELCAQNRILKDERHSLNGTALF